MTVTRSFLVEPPPLATTDEYVVVLVNSGSFDQLLRKDELLDEGVSAVFGLAGAEAHLLSLSFHAEKFTPSPVASWLTERKVTPLADVPNLGRRPSPLT